MGQTGHHAGHNFPALEEVDPATESLLGVVARFQILIVQLGFDTLADPFVALNRHERTARAAFVFKHVGAARVGRLPDLAEHLLDDVSPVRGRKKLLRGKADTLQNVVPPQQPFGHGVE